MRGRAPASTRKRGADTGPSPVDRRKTGSKHHPICDGRGTPLEVITTAATVNDVFAAGEVEEGMDPRTVGTPVQVGVRWRQTAENLEQREIVARGELHELAGDGVAFAGTPGVLEGLHETGVEREYHHVGVVEVSGDLFGFPRRLVGPKVSGSAMLECDGGQETRSKRW
ncbi:hypothetical protein [Streptomyces poriticola]|uniref:hypothetical protein n=1 Tax=Streptomyces poriticola TaxID=3120506 RepID=UPI002FCE496D